MNQSDANSTPPAAASFDTSLLWAERLTHWLIHRAARGAPQSLSERLEEEWHADLATRPTALSVQSSGSDRLDEGALKLAKAGWN